MTNPPGLDVNEFRQLGHRAVDLIAEYLAGIAARPVFTPMSPETRQALLDSTLPDHAVAADIILAAFAERVLPYPMGNGHPRFFGWVNSPPAPLGVIAEFLAAAMNPSCAGGDHAAIYLERCAMRWLMELVGFPTDGSMGLLVSGASVATLIGLVAARHQAAQRLGWRVREDGLQGNHPRLVLYTSTEGHSCLRKAAEILGLGAAAVRTIPVDEQFRMDLGALTAAVADDGRAGHVPFCVAASAGTVGTGAIDPLDAIADVCAELGLWLHVDGAYGALGILDASRRGRYTGLDRADSLALDPHKWLSVPVECGAILIRDGALLRDAFSLVPPYLRTEEGKGFGGLPWFSEYGVQQTRGYRALKLWMILLQLGRVGVARLVARHVALAEALGRRIDEASDLERLAPVVLSIVAFRYVPPGWSSDDSRLDELNKQLMERVQAAGSAFLTNTVVDGRFALRACVLHYDTDTADLEALVESVRDAGAACAREMGAAGHSSGA